MTPASPARQAIAAQLGMELRLTARRGENLLVILVVPVAVLLFFSAVPILSDDAGRPLDFLVPGVLALAIIATSFVNLGISTAFERGQGVLKRLGASPLSRSSLLAAKIVAVAVVELLQLAILVGLALVLGWQPGPGWSIAVVVAALVVGTVAFGGLGLLLAGTLRPEGTLALANGLFLVFLLLGGVVVPMSELPDAVELVARFLPAFGLSEALRIGLGASGGDALPALALLTAWAAGAAAAAVFTFRWD